MENRRKIEERWMNEWVDVNKKKEEIRKWERRKKEETNERSGERSIRNK